MAATAWQIYNKAKQNLGNGTIKLGVDNFKMFLTRTTSNVSTLTLSTFASVTGEISATGGYTAGGRALVPAVGQWVVGSAANKFKFTISTVGLAFTASGASLTNIRNAGIQNAAGKLLCYCQLSSSQFTVASPNTLTVLPAGAGIFTLT
jgi:hypothetical protein|tara:strand:- start:1807 stop:2253 length:447 start_codon:yes stop_codon:yes gene_type:complete